jgi:hypothetical protein
MRCRIRRHRSSSDFYEVRESGDIDMTTTVYDVTTFPASVPATTGTRIVHSVPQTAVEAYTQDYICVPMP